MAQPSSSSSHPSAASTGTRPSARSFAAISATSLWKPSISGADSRARRRETPSAAQSRTSRQRSGASAGASPSCASTLGCSASGSSPPRSARGRARGCTRWRGRDRSRYARAARPPRTLAWSSCQCRPRRRSARALTGRRCGIAWSCRTHRNLRAPRGHRDATRRSTCSLAAGMATYLS